MTRTLMLAAALLGQAFAAVPAPGWKGLKHVAGELKDPLVGRASWEGHEVYSLRSMLTPGVLLRMKSSSLRFFGGLDAFGAEPPTFFAIKTPGGAKAFGRDQAATGEQMAASWLVASFQGAKGWEQFDVPWFLSFEKRPKQLILTRDGLRVEFAAKDTGHIFSMPLYGYYKPPQEGNDFAAKHNLPSKGIRPWEWRKAVPKSVVERCDWWAAAAKAFPVGFQESFSVNPATDEITFHYDHRWLTARDDWGTKPLRFAPLSPTLGIAWKYPGFPMKLSADIHDPDYFTAFGPYVGAHDTDSLDITMKVLQHTNELERLDVPASPGPEQQKALEMIVSAMKGKFRSPWQFFYDHGDRGNYCWNIVADVWYSKALPFVPEELRTTAKSSLWAYMAGDVLVPYSPFHGKYLLHGPGIGSWGTWGDAGKFSANALQAIWAYGHYSGDWALLRDRWDLIKRYFITPEEANWAFFGRAAIAEMGDEAPPCSAYARMAWALGDHDEYLFGCYMFARELVHHYVKQLGGQLFYENQPYNRLSAMPPHIYPTNLWGSTLGWQVDGPIWGDGEHQSANRWVRFHDPDLGRFYCDHLANPVRKELEWYADAGRQDNKAVFNIHNYKNWFTKDDAHIMTSLARVRSFVLGEPYEALNKVVPLDNYKGVGGPGRIAVAYAYLRSMAPVKHERLVPKDVAPSPAVLGLQRSGPEEHQTTAQICYGGLKLEPLWGRWPMPKAPKGDWHRHFGTIEGDFGSRVPGREANQTLSYGCSVHWADSVEPRQLANPDAILAEQDETPVAVIGPFSNRNDSEIADTAYPPEKEVKSGASYEGFRGPVAWKQAKLAKGRTIDLRKALLEEGQSPWMLLAYVQQFVWSPQEQEVYLLAGHQGGVQAWVNAERVISHHENHGGFKPDAVRGLGKLGKGWNRILLKVECPGGEWRAQFRLVALDRQPIPGLRFAAMPQAN
ncbi:MAG TPA: hypothetical protein PLE19_14470 [Planctomycetota bacterium]|nr:hypothetical protein [Planctomycetota bacterium]HRR82634.1 hypothetical protein [Planctomycetota bacterium]HRT96011.1 hypothetical protein [Planctomycetota bacterium]